MTRGSQTRAAAAVVVLFGLGLCSLAHAATFHVDGVGGDDAADGLLWTTAVRTLGRALSEADTSPGMDEILIAEGTYLGEWTIASPVTIRGGFPSGGGAQDPEAHKTLLEGDPFGLTLLRFATGSDGSLLDGIRAQKAQVALETEATDVTVTRLHADMASAVRLYGARSVLRDSTLGDMGLSVRGSGSVVEGLRMNGDRAAAVRIRGNDIVLRDSVIVHAGGGYCRKPPSPFDSPFHPLGLDGTGLRIENVLVTEDAGYCDTAVLVADGSEVQISNLTVAGNQGWGLAVDGASATVVIQDSIFAENRLGWDFDGVPPGGYVQNGLTITYSLVQLGYPGAGNLDADPLFVAGPMAPYYLSQVGAGQAQNSPAVDAGLNVRTTRTDSITDAGTLDMGYHPVALASLEILRGTEPGVLVPHATVDGLPFADDPGTLTDPALPILFYRIPVALQPVRVEKDVPGDAVVLRF